MFKYDTLGLLIDVDSTLQDILQRGKSGAQTSKVYYLTLDGFKKCLMRAQRRKGQDADPVIYCDYYLLLEKIFKLYRDYESAYDKKMLSMRIYIWKQFFCGYSERRIVNNIFA